ncbi:TlpA disulfide reductase family protein [Oxalobacteraceae bacterium R-40]|uniref:TlpA disulfide reductase family protein n=1 Tax=Keguizhuia sedimenti TaxID=3064264 RepID=A0ABU1BNX6_9BURK|nr:TlpA disulfide reductase family protein [Oxalobacteraceae bacterium R-40]
MNRVLLHSLICLLVLFQGIAHAADVQVGQRLTLPAITVMDGKQIKPGDLRNKVIVLSYFSTTCPFCMNEAPKLQALQESSSADLVVIGVDINHADPEQESKVMKWRDRFRLTHPITIDYKRIESALGKPKGIPSHYIIDKNGVLKQIELGEMHDEDFEDIARFARKK